MIDLSQDPLVNVVHEGIKGDVRAVLEIGRWRAAVSLIFAGMDQMAFLGLPQGQEEVHGPDFIRWANGYMRVEDAPGPQPSGDDYYGARCGMLDTYTSSSRKSRAGTSRHLFYKYRQGPPSVVFLSEVPPHEELKNGCFVVDVEALARAFFRGVDAALVDVFNDSARRVTAEARFRRMYHLTPAPRP